MNVNTKITVTIKIPMVPNFLRYGDQALQSIDVADLDEKLLLAVAKEWTSKLLENARKRRERRKDEGGGA